MEWFIEYWHLWASFNTWCIQIRSEGEKGFELNVENVSWQSFPKENIYQNRKKWEISSEAFAILQPMIYFVSLIKLQSQCLLA